MKMIFIVVIFFFKIFGSVIILIYKYVLEIGGGTGNLAETEVDGALSLLNWFADFLVALGVIDSPEVNTYAIELLSRIVDRISSHSEWREMRYDPSRGDNG